MRKRGKYDQHDNHERWLLTYADMITLLMAFFIMMYSMSVLNLSKFRDAAVSIRSGFGGVLKGQGRSILGTSGSFPARPSPIDGDTAGVPWRVIRPLAEYVENDTLAKQTVTLGEDERGLVITLLSDRALFDPGRAELKPEAYPVLDRIAEVLYETANRIQVEGHTCDLPLREPRYASNLELSIARARTVYGYLTKQKGLGTERFSVVGHGSTRPAYPNENEANRNRNRRVEIVLVRPEAARASQNRDAAPTADRPVPEVRRRSDR